MATDSPLTMLSEMGSGGDGSEDRVSELSLYRSGSAPPTVDVSRMAVRGLLVGDFPSNGAGAGTGLLSDEVLRADPAYFAYYYSHANLNPRLPPPVLSKEDRRPRHRVQSCCSALGGVGDGTKSSPLVETVERSLLSLPPVLYSVEEEREEAHPEEWSRQGDDRLIGLSGSKLPQERSYTDIFQDELGQRGVLFSHKSHGEDGNEFGDVVESLDSAESQLALHYEAPSVDGLRAGGNTQTVVHNIGASLSHSFASVVGSSLSKSTSSDSRLVARTPSPRLPPVGARFGVTGNKFHNGSCSINGVSPGMAVSDDLVAALSGMNLSPAGAVDNDTFAQLNLHKELDSHWNFPNDLKGGQNYMKQNTLLKRSEAVSLSKSSNQRSVNSSYTDFFRSTGDAVDWSSPALRLDEQVELHRNTATNAYFKANYAPSAASRGISSTHYQNGDNSNTAFMGHGISGYSINPGSQSVMANHISTSNLLHDVDSSALGRGFSSGPTLTGTTDLQNPNRNVNHTAAAAFHMHLDPLYLQCLGTAEHASQDAANASNLNSSYVNLLGLHKAYLGALLPLPKQYGLPLLGKTGLSDGYFGQPPYVQGASCPGNPLATPIPPASPIGPGSPLRQGGRNIGVPSGLRNLTGGVMDSWLPDTCGGMDEFPASLLEEFKCSKTRSYELSEIAGHVVEFSADQYGSRFIQQKLETATSEEKDMVYEEIMPQTLTLMTDVFGNYVVQKFLEHGSPDQIRELANKLNGHVLALSLQMYGCRVIQKALEVVDLDQKTRMVTELDGHVMRCVRDQNGNHVIQKCIECIPQDAIQFIISVFYDQVVALSAHPYGCRVIQRILEHCNDPKTQQIVMDEIMQCVCMLAQDQYGNYVVQHVLEHGKPQERSAIIQKLAGQIVQMSQQKFASNVVEKCLTFGSPVERQVLINEILGSTDENEPLQAMMKDQFGNYVVQKVLGICDDQQRELILSRIKVHLNALKKYTYGKHIVARVEKLVAAGERRIGLQSSYTL